MSAHAPQPVRTPLTAMRLAAALLVVLAAPSFFVFEDALSGFALIALGLFAAWWADTRCSPAEASAAWVGGGSAPQKPPSLLRDLSLIAVGLAIIRIIPLAAELDNFAMLRFTLALGGAVAVPYLVSRFVYRDRAIGFPWRGRDGQWGARRWRWPHWVWLGAVIVLGWLILPFYFIESGVYENWPTVTDADLIARLFIGVNAVGIWDELFFICTVFVLLMRHFPAALANLLQAVVFVSFLWELGYQSWGPVLTIPFALVQGFIFLRTRSLTYVVTVHLLFDAVVFLVLVYAHNPAMPAIFPTAP